LGGRYSERSCKFFEDQVEEVARLIRRRIKQEGDISLEKYLAICEQLGRLPDPEKMPLTDADFPVEVQVAFFIYNYLSDRWDGASGAYMGKDWSSLSITFDMFDIVEDRSLTFQFMKIIEAVTIDTTNEKISQKRKASERAAKAKS